MVVGHCAMQWQSISITAKILCCQYSILEKKKEREKYPQGINLSLDDNVGAFTKLCKLYYWWYLLSLNNTHTHKLEPEFFI